MAYIVFRGSESRTDWRSNIRFIRDLFTIQAMSGDRASAREILPVDEINPSTGTYDLAPDAPRAQLHEGFTNAYRSIQDRIHDYVRQQRPGSVTITGHSLGGALATLCAIDIQLTYQGNHPVEIYTFGAPRVGNSDFQTLYDANVSDSFRIVNGLDIVPGLPRWWQGYRHVNSLHRVGTRFTYRILSRRVTDHFVGNYMTSMREAEYRLASRTAPAR